MADQENPGADTVYGRRPWNIWDRGPADPVTAVVGTGGPDERNDSKVVRERILSSLTQLATYKEPVLFRPRFGYDTAALGVSDILPDTAEQWQNPNDAPNTGSPAEVNSGLRTSLTGSDNLGRF